MISAWCRKAHPHEEAQVTTADTRSGPERLRGGIVALDGNAPEARGRVVWLHLHQMCLSVGRS